MSSTVWRQPIVFCMFVIMLIFNYSIKLLAPVLVFHSNFAKMLKRIYKATSQTESKDNNNHNEIYPNEKHDVKLRIESLIVKCGGFLTRSVEENEELRFPMK